MCCKLWAKGPRRSLPSPRAQSKQHESPDLVPTGPVLSTGLLCLVHSRKGEGGTQSRGPFVSVSRQAISPQPHFLHTCIQMDRETQANSAFQLIYLFKEFLLSGTKKYTKTGCQGFQPGTLAVCKIMCFLPSEFPKHQPALFHM